MTNLTDLYTEHFGLHRRPFSLLPDPDFLFWSPAHRRAYTMLEYGLHTKAPITLISGEVGVGKTTLVHHLLKSMDDDVTVGMIANSHAGRDMMRWILMSLDLEAPADLDYVDLFKRFQDFLIEEYSQGRRVVLIFDEAQNLDRDSLEELRMLTNINANRDELLQLVLVGQPELREIVSRPDLTQFAQRISSSFHLSRMDEETVGNYIRHRMSFSGATEDLFTPGAIKLIYLYTDGIPRLVNQLADFALLYASTDQRDNVTAHTVHAVLKDGVYTARTLRLENPL